MPEIVKAHLWQPGPREQGLEAVRGDVAAVQGLPTVRQGERGELTVTGLDFPVAFDVLAVDHGIAHLRFRPETTNSAEFERKFSRFEAGLVTAA